MRPTIAALCTIIGCASFGVTKGQAEVSQDQFPPKTTGDLVALCNATKVDPLMTAALNFCNGFAEGAVELALGYESVARKDRQPFCLPTPRPSHNEAVAQFTTWANAEPKRLEEPPIIGLFRFLEQQYPCLYPATTRTGKDQRSPS